MTARYIYSVLISLVFALKADCESGEFKNATHYDFRLVKRDGFGSTFRIRNGGTAPINLPTLLPANEDGVMPHYVRYQFMKNGRWHEISNYFHGAYNEYSLRPGRSVTVSIGLNHFQNVKSGTKVRILWGDFPSESFRWSDKGISQ